MHVRSVLNILAWGADNLNYAEFAAFLESTLILLPYYAWKRKVYMALKIFQYGSGP